MVEGHSVHRVAARHRQRLIGKTFSASSPNGRFTQGALAIHKKPFTRIEAVGKNLFAFFGNNNEHDTVVVHVHFGMAGNWAIYDRAQDAPEPSKTNRLRLEGHGMVIDLSAMTVKHGGIDLYNEKRQKLGQDPLRDDADPELLWNKVSSSKKSIGALIMDQSYFTGPGNIYRAEILFKAGVHPDVPGNELEKFEFDNIWAETVALLRRGYETGSILTVDPQEGLNCRRYIYNKSHCPRCQTSIRVWTIASRTCYACPTCQPRKRTKTAAVVTPTKECVPFLSHCAPESLQDRLKASGPARLTVPEIRSELVRMGVEAPRKAKKAELVKLLEDALEGMPNIVSSEDAAMEKAIAGESLAVEHIAELAPGQARKARARATAATPVTKTESDIVAGSTKRGKRKAVKGEKTAKRTRRSAK